MKSIKPGRTNSAVGIAGSIFAIVFGIFWMKMTFGMGGMSIFPLFGIFFIGMAVFNLVISINNTFGKNRTSLYDITEDGEEEDPLFSHKSFCPYCGGAVGKGHQYCSKCGERIS